MSEQEIEQQALEIEQEVQDLLTKTDEYAEQVDMEKVLKDGKESAQKLQQPDAEWLN